MRTISKKYCLKEEDDFGISENLSPLFALGETISTASWEKRRARIRAQWLEVLGTATEKDTGGSPQKIGEFSRPECTGSIFRQPTIGGASALMVLLEPTNEGDEKSPGVILPVYTPDLMVGYDLAADRSSFDRPNLQFGYHLVQQGYKVICIEAFPYNTVEDREKYAKMEVWAQAAKQLLEKNPRWTGAGRMISDTVRAVDFLLGQRNLDLERIAIMGHSLGGEDGFYDRGI